MRALMRSVPAPPVQSAAKLKPLSREISPCPRTIESPTIKASYVLVEDGFGKGFKLGFTVLIFCGLGVGAGVEPDSKLDEVFKEIGGVGGGAELGLKVVLEEDLASEIKVLIS